MKFEDLGLSPAIMQAIATKGYVTPTPIQAQAIPHALRGEDLLGCAETGSGKTAAFAIPILHRLTENGNPSKGQGRRIRALVIAPTRELSVQILDSFFAYGANTPLKFTSIYGGVPQSGQERALRNGADVVIATPGRLMDLINQRIVDLGQVEMLVLDEADRMLDMGFMPDIRKILSYIPQNRQTLFFSATMPRNVQVLADALLKNPINIRTENPKGTVDRIEQSIFMVPQKDKANFLVSFLGSEPFNSAIVFTRTRHGADKVVMRLRRAKIYAEAIHGDKSQSTRQRTLDGFRNRQVHVLVATDIAARGIDVDHISHVINFDLPREAETYVHRIGRTARAGAKGKAVTFCDSTERNLLRQVEKVMGKRIPVVQPSFEFVQEPASEKAEPYKKVTPNRQFPPARSGGGNGGGSRSGSGGGSRSGGYGSSPRSDGYGARSSGNGDSSRQGGGEGQGGGAPGDFPKRKNKSQKRNKFSNFSRGPRSGSSSGSDSGAPSSSAE